MVRGRCIVVPTVTLPKAKLPLREIMRVGTGVPVPDAVLVLAPLLASELTVTVPL